MRGLRSHISHVYDQNTPYSVPPLGLAMQCPKDVREELWGFYDTRNQDNKISRMVHHE